MWTLLGNPLRDNPQSVALAAPGRAPLTYRGLAEVVQQTVKTLNRLGIGRNDRIALVLPNGAEMAAAFIAIGSGATCAPLNPAYGAAELDFYLTDLNARALVALAGAPSAARDAAVARQIPVLELSPVADGPAGSFMLDVTGASDCTCRMSDAGFAQQGDAALVLHTSGTTARPKIVVLTQANICASATNISAFLGLGPADQCLNVMQLFHIHGLIGAVLSSLSAGASVFCTRGFSEHGFFTQLKESAATWYTAVPTMHQAVLAQAPSARDAIAARPLRFIRSSSAALPPKVMAELEAAFGAPVVEAYGMTEASHQMTCNPLPPRERKPGSVGVAAGLEAAVLDEAGAPLPPLTVGEIAIRGANVTPGYENNPDANAKAFTSDGWFRTGDQGHLDAEGYLFITGRLKEIINRGGEKISPREIDEALLDHPAVAQAVTFSAPHPTLGEDVAAAVVLRDGAVATEADLRRYVAGRLAYFKVPRRVVALKEIPKGPTGKIQRVGLAQRLGLAADDAPALARADFVAPSTPMERSLARLFSDVLRLSDVGAEDNFFLLGGDSLGATRLLVRVRESLGVEVPVAAFFNGPTIAAVGRFISEQARRISADPTSVLDEIEGMSEEEAERLLAEESKLGHTRL